MPLRPYQTACLDAITSHLQAGTNLQLAVLATGLGKTKISSELPDRLRLSRGQRMLFLVHLDVLADQAIKSLAESNPLRTVGLEKAGSRAGDADIVVASVQTLGKTNGDGECSARLRRLNPADFRVIVVDEAHHSCKGKNYHSILRHMRLLKGEQELRRDRLLLGITATPNRSDNVGMECLFDQIVFHYDLRRGVEEGWLARPIGFRVETEIDLSKVRREAGDFCTTELAETVNTPERNALVARKHGELGNGDPSLFFTVDIQHANDLAAALREEGFRVYPISGKTPQEECRRLLDLLRERRIDGLASCQKIAEGADIPVAVNAHMARPTLSRLFYQQIAGRVTRLYPSPEELAYLSNLGQLAPWVKTSCRLIDYVDNSVKHPLVTCPTLFGLREKFDPQGKAILPQVEEIEQLELDHPGADLRGQPSLDHIRTNIRQLDLLAPPATPSEIKRLSSLPWKMESDGVYHVGALEGKLLSVRVDTLGQWQVYEHSRGIRTLRSTARSLGQAIAAAEELIPDRDRQILRADASWRRDAPTEKQVRTWWILDRKLKAQFPTPNHLFEFATAAYHRGDPSYNRGAISDRIDARQHARG